MASRINSKSILPSHPAVQKRDSSYLDWHYKTPSEEELQDQYECFTETEWAGHYQASKESTSLSSKKKNDPAIMNVEAKQAACDGCQLFYQIWARNKGLCHPVEGAITPLDRIGQDEE